MESAGSATASNDPLARPLEPPTLAEALPEVNSAEEDETPISRLTDREFDILRLLPTRLSNLDIATRLHISQNTVKTHLKEIYRKLRVGCRNDAIVVATRHGLLTLNTATWAHVSK